MEAASRSFARLNFSFPKLPPTPPVRQETRKSFQFSLSSETALDKVKERIANKVSEHLGNSTPVINIQPVTFSLSFNRESALANIPKIEPTDPEGVKIELNETSPSTFVVRLKALNFKNN